MAGAESEFSVYFRVLCFEQFGKSVILKVL